MILLLNIHRIFSMMSFVTIIIFWLSTLIVELFFDYNSIAFIKSLIVFPGLFILVPSIIITAITGNILAKQSLKSELVAKKRKRMPIIGAVGILVLIPSAIYLDILATKQAFDIKFYLLQVLEIIAGVINISLMYLNIKDSLKNN